MCGPKPRYHPHPLVVEATLSYVVTTAGDSDHLTSSNPHRTQEAPAINSFTDGDVLREVK